MLTVSSKDSRFALTDEQAQKLASTFGTPLYVIDEEHFRNRIRRYMNAFKAAWPKAELTYASKANSTLAVLAIAHQEGCLIDVASEGELRAAIAAGVPAGRCHLHGNNKQPNELEFAFKAGVNQIVVDNFDEIELIAKLAQTATCPDLVLRLAPGVDPVTHHKISTGQADTKFGFNISDGSAEKAVVKCLGHQLPLVGFHCHVGSQLLDPEAQRSGGEIIARFAVEMLNVHNFSCQIINVGGGLGVRYTDEDSPMAVEDYCALVVDAVKEGLGDSELMPVLTQEPGRSMIGESGVTLYKVGVVKTVPAQSGPKTYICVDGGLSDNPRPVMYGSRYTVKAITAAPASGSKAYTVSGKHCETDKLFENVELPANIQPGDLIQVLTTGAYNSSMASNYNRYQRPATVLIRPNGEHALVQRLETWDEMFARETIPEGMRR